MAMLFVPFRARSTSCGNARYPSGPTTKLTCRALARSFGPFVYQLYGSRRDVCTAVTVGQRQVTKREPVDADAAWRLQAELATLPSHEVTVTEDVVEWKCPSVLGSS